MNEIPICQARANVMTYDDANKKWIPSGSSPGLSKVQIYQHTVNSTFRVVGRKLQDHEVVINCAILKNLKYNQATQTFHQWRDSRHVYGLNFANKEDSEVFANSMMTALDTLNNQGRPMPPPNPPPTGPPGYQQQFAETQQNGPQQQISEDNRSTRHRRYPSGGAPAPYNMPQVPQEPAFQPPQPAPAPSAIPAPPGPPPAAPAPPPAPPAAPAAPPAPPAPPACGPPPAPPPPGVGGGAPPAPPPPPMGGNSPEEGGPTGLVAALQAARLKPTVKHLEANGEVGGSPSNRPPKGGGSMDHMSELQKRLAKRKDTQDDQISINVTSSPSQPPVQNRDSGPSRQREVSTIVTKHTNGTGSPQPIRRNPSLTEQDHTTRPADANAISNSELEALKQDILTEMRKDMNKMKQEILDAIRDSSR